jgi:hypothetical protein
VDGSNFHANIVTQTYCAKQGSLSMVCRMTKPDHITSGDACRILRVNATTLAKWARDGAIPSTKLPGRNGAFVYKRADIERFADARAAARQENAS